MSLGERFERFFAALNDGRRPYPWQRLLMEEIARTGRWPAAVEMPTGSGKSVVIDIHVFLVAERARARLQAQQGETTAIARTPRRLVLVAPRRALVENQFERAQRVATQLQQAAKPGGVADAVVRELSEALASLHTTEGDHTAEGDETRAQDPGLAPLGVTQLRGGVQLDRGWRLDPAQCQVICATPQMWGSRLLLRGYRSTRRSRNLETGLLAHDAVTVIDEAHLHERLLETASRIAQDDQGPLGLQVVAMSATRVTAGSARLGADDVADEDLRRRVEATKRISTVAVDDWSKQAVTALVVQAKRLRDELDAEPRAAGTVGVFVNTVRMALDVVAGLDGRSAVVICGRMRPADLEEVRSKHPGLLEERGNAKVDYLVATQSLEVGVDLDLPAIVTAVASASALAQRAGRLNRSGRRGHSELVVVVPREQQEAALAEVASEMDEVEEPGMFRPYRDREIVDAIRWIASLDTDASPRNITATPLPVPHRLQLPALSQAEIETAAMAGDDLAADIDVSFYIDEPLDEESQSISIGARLNLDLPEDLVREVLLAAPPRAHELASFPLRPTSPLKALLSKCEHCWVIRYEKGNIDAHRYEGDGGDLKPGDVLLVPDGSRICTRGAIGLVGTRREEPLEDVMSKRPDGQSDIVVELPWADVNGVCEEHDPTLGSRAARKALAGVADAVGATEAAELLGRHRRLNKLAVSWCVGVDNDQGLLVLRSTEQEGALPGVSLREDRAISIDEHSAAVRKRLELIIDKLDVDSCGDLGIPREGLLDAARWHDAGKCHPRFQERMGRREGDPELAKPAPRHIPDRGGDGWRHEQLSAAYAWVWGSRDPYRAVLCAGHHGHGLTRFDRTPSAVLDGWGECEPDVIAALHELFGDCGRYELERLRLVRSLGLHRLAHHEALLRCADIQVSREGS